MSLDHLGLYISLAGVLGTLIFGWLRWRRDYVQDTAALLRECEQDRQRLREENVDLLRRIVRETGSDD